MKKLLLLLTLMLTPLVFTSCLGDEDDDNPTAPGIDIPEVPDVPDEENHAFVGVWSSGYITYVIASDSTGYVHSIDAENLGYDSLLTFNNIDEATLTIEIEDNQFNTDANSATLSSDGTTLTIDGVEYSSDYDEVAIDEEDFLGNWADAFFSTLTFTDTDLKSGSYNGADITYSITDRTITITDTVEGFITARGGLIVNDTDIDIYSIYSKQNDVAVADAIKGTWVVIDGDKEITLVFAETTDNSFAYSIEDIYYYYDGDYYYDYSIYAYTTIDYSATDLENITIADIDDTVVADNTVVSLSKDGRMLTMGTNKTINKSDVPLHMTGEDLDGTWSVGDPATEETFVFDNSGSGYYYATGTDNASEFLYYSIDTGDGSTITININYVDTTAGVLVNGSGLIYNGSLFEADN